MQTIWALRQSGQAWQESAQAEWAARQLLNWAHFTLHAEE